MSKRDIVLGVVTALILAVALLPLAVVFLISVAVLLTPVAAVAAPTVLVVALPALVLRGKRSGLPAPFQVDGAVSIPSSLH